MTNMNPLELALLQNSGSVEDLDFYLETTPTETVRKDIEEIKRKAADATNATQKLAAIKAVLDNTS